MTAQAPTPTLIVNARLVNEGREFDGDLGIFSNLLEDLSSHLQTVSRKAEVAEKRHVEAARGKERLAMARERAASVVEGMLKKQNLPRFTHTLLSQAWTDVMALTALRQGEDSDAWKQQLEIAERLLGQANPHGCSAPRRYAPGISPWPRRRRPSGCGRLPYPRRAGRFHHPRLGR